MISWNVNGLRSISNKGKLQELIQTHNPDVLCLQEIRCDDSIATKLLIDAFKDVYPYIVFNTSKERKGYSGTSVLSKIKIVNVEVEMEKYLQEHQDKNDEYIPNEGRVIKVTLSNKFVIVNVYTPNSGPRTLARLDYRIETWDVVFGDYIQNVL